jgi:hypothetical protein
VELSQVTHQGALLQYAIPQDLQETSERFVSQRLLSVIPRHVSLLQGHRGVREAKQPQAISQPDSAEYFWNLRLNVDSPIYKAEF